MVTHREVFGGRASDDVHCCLPEPVSRNLFKALRSVSNTYIAYSQLRRRAQCSAVAALCHRKKERSAEIRDSYDGEENPSRAACAAAAASHPYLIKIVLYAAPRRAGGVE